MKTKFTFILLLFSLFGMANDSKNEELNQLKDKISILQKKVDKLETIDNANDIVEEYRALNDIYSYGFGILLALFGIVFPLIIYLVQIRPSLDTIKETKSIIKKIDDNFEESFAEHLKKSKNKLIDQAIENYLDSASTNISSSYAILDMYKSEGFTELQVVRLLKILRNKDNDKNRLIFIASILTFQEDSNIEEYFVTLIRNDPSNHLCIWGAIYFANYNKSKHIHLISLIVLNGYSLVGMLASLSSSSKDFALELLNCETLVNNVEKKVIFDWCNSGYKHFSERIGIDKVETTLLWKRYIENNKV
ncbi:hypothetical protein ACI6PS_03675 [Flavobacterium sp. PLA-1-15]|uniref:hypothetical protein n=1 Tax=Flavobacterium sp. PLA-1-15 TaxID=3380533 RepID=UPI003B7A2A0C